MNWEKQLVSVRGKNFTLADIEGGKLYHGSPYQMKPGSILVPGKKKNYSQSKGKKVSITSDLQTARYWGTIKFTETGYIYEVEPLDEIEIWKVALANFGQNIDLLEGLVSRAKIKKLVEVVPSKSHKVARDWLQKFITTL